MGSQEEWKLKAREFLEDKSESDLDHLFSSQRSALVTAVQECVADAGLTAPASNIIEGFLLGYFNSRFPHWRL